MWGPTQNLGPIGLAVLTCVGLNRQTSIVYNTYACLAQLFQENLKTFKNACRTSHDPGKVYGRSKTKMFVGPHMTQERFMTGQKLKCL